MAIKTLPKAKTKTLHSAKKGKHSAKPASLQQVLKTYGLTRQKFTKLERYVEKRLGHALAA
jgi:hypothetical protein